MISVLCWPGSTTRGCCFLISFVFLHKPQSFDKQTYIDTHYPSKVHHAGEMVEHFSCGAQIYRDSLSMLSMTIISTDKCDYACITHTHTHTLIWVFTCVFWVPEFGHRAVDYSVTRNTCYRGLARVARDTLNRTEEEGKKQRQRKKTEGNWRKQIITIHHMKEKEGIDIWRKT